MLKKQNLGVFILILIVVFLSAFGRDASARKPKKALSEKSELVDVSTLNLWTLQDSVKSTLEVSPRIHAKEAEVMASKGDLSQAGAWPNPDLEISGSDKLGIDVWEVISLANRHPRVNILSPGPGVGGHCISVDPWFLVHSDPDATLLIRTAREVNDAKPHHIVAHVRELAGQFSRPKIGCLGLTYKANVDDLRESPSLAITRQLIADEVGEVLACDPYVSAVHFTEIRLHPLQSLLEQCQILVLLTDHRQFKNIPHRVRQEKVVVDTRGMWRGAND